MDSSLAPYLNLEAEDCNDETGFQAFKKLAELGYPHAMTQLSQYYAGYICCMEHSKNLAENVRWLKEAMKANEPHAFWLYGINHMYGNYFEKDPEKALYYFNKAHELGFDYQMRTIECHELVDSDGGIGYILHLFKKYIREEKYDEIGGLKFYLSQNFPAIDLKKWLYQEYIKLDDENGKLKEILEKQEKEIKELKDKVTELEYRPGNPGYAEAKHHFKKMKNKIYK